MQVFASRFLFATEHIIQIYLCPFHFHSFAFILFFNKFLLLLKQGKRWLILQYFSASMNQIKLLRFLCLERIQYNVDKVENEMQWERRGRARKRFLFVIVMSQRLKQLLPIEEKKIIRNRKLFIYEIHINGSNMKKLQ